MIQETIDFAVLGAHPNVLMAIAAVGYEEPPSIQTQSIPLIPEGHDMVGQAQTSIGKIAALAPPLLSYIDPNRHEPQMLMLVSTRELALQVATTCETYSKQLSGVGVVAVYDGTPMGPQLKALCQGAQTLTATPDRLCGHLCRDEELLVTIQRLVLDEADETLKLGLMDDLEVIFEVLPESHQTILFSATLSASICGIAERHLKQPRHVKITAETQIVVRIEQIHLMVHADQKVGSIQRLLEVEQFDVLTASVCTKQAILGYAELLERQSYRAVVLNGDMSQAQCERVIESLKGGSLDIVIATDVVARGLDVPRITHVLNIDVPYDPESYMYRIGRTGRVGREGRALLLVTPREWHMLQVIERATGQKVGEVHPPDTETASEARLIHLTVSLTSLLDSAVEQRDAVCDELRRRPGYDAGILAAALLTYLTVGKALDLESMRREQPLTPSTPHGRADRGERDEHPKRSGERRPIVLLNKGRARCRTALDARGGAAAKSLLDVTPNENDLSREDIGRTQIRGTFSLTGLPEADLEHLLTKLKDIRVAGRALRLCRYREN